MSEADYARLGPWAIVHAPDSNIDPRTRQRTAPLRVLCLAMPRTGTLSMQEALTILGYPTYHFSSIFGNVRDCDMWIEALDYKLGRGGKPYGRKEFDQLLGHVGAVTDVPGIVFWKELIEGYPDAKVVLIDRDLENWEQSFAGLLEGVMNPIGRYIFRYTDPFWHGKIVGGVGLRWIEYLLSTTDLDTAKRNARGAYEKHYRDIRAAVPKERLLNYQMGQGWEPLCEFLGKEVPKEEFPHRNEAKTLEMCFGDVISKSVKRSLFNMAVVVGAGAVIGTAVWRAAAGVS